MGPIKKTTASYRQCPFSLVSIARLPIYIQGTYAATCTTYHFLWKPKIDDLIKPLEANQLEANYISEGLRLSTSFDRGPLQQVNTGEANINSCTANTGEKGCIAVVGPCEKVGGSITKFYKWR